MSDCPGTTTERTIGGAKVVTDCAGDGQARVAVHRAFVAGLAPATADHVWRIVADFGGLKLIFPGLVRLYLAYPDAADTVVGTVRDMAFDPGPRGGPLNLGVEQLIALDETERRLAYVSVLGLPVADYRSEMSVTGADACTLAWISTCRVSKENAGFLGTLGEILAGGANQIAAHLGLP